MIPQAQLAAPQVAAFLDRPPAGSGFDLDEFTVLVEVDRLGPDVLDAVPGGLPAGPPIAGQVDPVARRAGQLADRDAKGLRDGDCDRKDGLLLAGLVAPDLARVDACRLGEVGLGQAEFGSAASDDLGQFHRAQHGGPVGA